MNKEDWLNIPLLVFAAIGMFGAFFFAINLIEFKAVYGIVWIIGMSISIYIPLYTPIKELHKG